MPRPQAALLSLPVIAALVVALASCAEELPVRVLALRGCELDQTFSGLRVQVVGDFPAGGGQALLLGPDEAGSLAELREDAQGLTVEGLFGASVSAVGRSYGVDVGLARGRADALEDGQAALVVYFSPPDTACAAEGAPTGRSEVAIAEGRRGDVLLAGGRAGLDGPAIDELVHVDLLTGEVRVLEQRLPAARVGAALLPLVGRRFALISGAESGAVFSSWTPIEVAGEGQVGEARGLAIHGEPMATAYAASATSPVDGRTLLVGGCTSVTGDDRCVPASALLSTAWVDVEDGELALDHGPALAAPRFGATLRFSADGVAYLVGGYDAEGAPALGLERVVPGGAWETVHTLPEDLEPEGLAVLAGELVLISTLEGTLRYWSPGGSGVLSSDAWAPALGPSVAPRPMLALPGERVIADGWLFAPGSAAADPSDERVRFELPGRADAALLPLLDGSVLIAGGVHGSGEAVGEVVEPSLLRLRPALDGPDEGHPDLGSGAAFVVSPPGAGLMGADGLRLDGLAQPSGGLPLVHGHLRGFRSAGVRLDFSLSTEGAGTRAWLLVSQGSLASVGVSLLGELVVRQRLADGSLRDLDCAAAQSSSASSLVLEIDDEGRRLIVSTEDGRGELQRLVDCELGEDAWPQPEAGLALGFGAQGTGSVRVSNLRLARL
ncbi:hypothetical protein G6O69_29455 [Pseudenhygromyxa sp. WMMC2535]|uniref:hypothetical protein n=1 Tax=Pseudenhygromyxa sp. WMMC2535 TaxID=2712867 RepID=UPI001556662D|nr:hypothetical protein [Pseudenhygromyxa sp. WMMC2535]NVB41990.1 hypothetical protein [Pseudenhygromyxa sp. WMMC2535]